MRIFSKLANMEPIDGERTLLGMSFRAAGTPKWEPSLADTSDEAVWVRAVQGDGEAFGVIFDRHRRRVFNHCVRLVPTIADADDAVAITFLESWRLRKRIRFVGSSILPWLLATATNCARNLSRSSSRYRAVLDQLPPGETQPDPADSIGQSAAELALSALSVKDQRVVTLCVIEGYSERDAAEALGVPPGTVKSRLARAKSRMRASLDTSEDRPLVVSKETQHDF